MAIGQPVLRKEDAELLTGQARFVDDLTLPGMIWMAVVRSPYAHARIKAVDVSQALAADGVVAAFSGQDLAEDMARPACPAPGRSPRTPSSRPTGRSPPTRRATRATASPSSSPRSRALAKDAAELVEVEYEPLDAVTDVGKALDDGAPLVHDEFDSNECYIWKLEAGEVDRLFAEADVTVYERYYQHRLMPNAIEPRGVLVQPVPAQGEYTVWSATQVPHILRVLLAMTLEIPETKLRVIAPDVGGGFGSKLNVYAEEALALALARKLGRPVKWIEERSEAYVATIHGRDVIQEIELAATADGKMTAVRARLTAAMGAYLQLVTPGHTAARRLAVRRRVPRAGLRVRRAPASSRTRRRPTRTAAPAGRSRRTRSSGRWTRWRASWTWTRSSCAARTSSPTSPRRWSPG